MLLETLDLYLQDFGRTVKVGAAEIVVIFDMPDDVVGGVGISTEYQLTIKTSDASGVDNGTSVEIDGAAYRVRSARKVDDGAFTRLALTKL